MMRLAFQLMGEVVGLIFGCSSFQSAYLSILGQGIHWSMNLCEESTLQKMGEIGVDKANIKCFKCSNRV